MKYKTYLRNHAVYPGSEKALHSFVNAVLVRDGEEIKHKWEYAFNSNSEDALIGRAFSKLY